MIRFEDPRAQAIYLRHRFVAAILDLAECLADPEAAVATVTRLEVLAAELKRARTEPRPDESKPRRRKPFTRREKLDG